MDSTQDPTKTTIYLPPGVHRALKIEAAQRQKTMSEIILEALLQRNFLVKSNGDTTS
jgi:hypothetical protein